MTPPDSDAHEVRCPHGYFVVNAKSLCLQCHPEPVSIPLSLAQRILAALEGEATIAAAHGWLDRVALLTALADELRDRMPK